MLVSYYSWHSSHRGLFFSLSLCSSIHHRGQGSNAWEVSTGEKHNKTTELQGLVVLAMNLLQQQPGQTLKPQTWNCSPQTESHKQK